MKTKIKSEIRTPLSELVRFKNSRLAKEIRRELLRWRRDLIAMYPAAESLLEKGKIDGRLEALIYVMELVDEMIRVKEEEQDGAGRNETN